MSNKITEERKKFDDIEMKIELTNRCLHGRCKFCSPLFRPVVKEAENEIFLNLFKEHVKRYLKQGGRKIILTGGGEPLDAPEKLFGALKIINIQKDKLKVDLDLLTVYSNGVKLLSPISEGNTKIFLDRLVELGVKDINLSISGLTPEEISEISGEKMGNIDFDTLIPSIREKNIRVMTRTTLAKGYIDSISKVAQFTNKMSKLGVGIIYFSDLFEVPIRNDQTTPGSKKILNWTDEHRIDFLKLVEDIKNHPDFTFISQVGRHKEQGQTFEFQYKNRAKVLFGNLVIGNESDDIATYYYIKSDGSMGVHNNICQKKINRNYTSINEIREYRPERDDL
jgi:MoaA/NifB/PqqE/SkfB family radical SAM enzyme